MTPVSIRSFGGAGDAGIYTRAQQSEFWDNFLISAASRKALQKFSPELIVPNSAIHGTEKYFCYAPRTDFYLDKMISRNYFENQFMDTFGSISYILEFCGIYFICFLFITRIGDLIMMVLRHLENHRLAGASLGFARTLLSASYNFFLTSIPTSVFNHQTPLLQALEPEATPTRLEDETGDPIDESKKKEKHVYTIVHHPTTAPSPVWLG